MAPTPVERYDALRDSNEFLFVVFYRGSWCPFCQAYLKDLEALSGKIVAAGGHVLAVTAENEDGLTKMRQTSGYTGETIVDPENLLARELKRRNIIDIAISDHKGYPHGMAQPAVLVGGKRELLYTWAIAPSMMNLGGAKDRPVLSQIWGNVDAKMQGKPPTYTKLEKTTVATGLKHVIFG